MIKKQVMNTLVLIASAGCYLAEKDNPSMHAREIWLGKNDKPDNYVEIVETENNNE